MGPGHQILQMADMFCQSKIEYINGILFQKSIK